MVSAVSYPQPSPPPPPSPSVQDLAAAGYFRAIALWVNEPLTAQGIFVKVQADRPGCLRLIVEFDRAPIKERLLRYLCHRIWLLNSELIEGVYVLARPVGQRRLAWQKRIRIVTPALKQRQAAIRLAAPAVPKPTSPLPPQMHQRLAHLSHQHLKTFRALLLTGSAVAAFIFGCLLEVVTAGSAPMLPSFSTPFSVSAPSPQPAAGDRADALTGQRLDQTQATPIDYRAPDGPNPPQDRGSKPDDAPPPVRPTVVDAALEPVGVIQHHRPAAPASADVTLLFSGDVSLADLAYDSLAKAGGLFTGVEGYAQVDLSMVTLGSPLATAATTLEEELYHRNRPDAVNLLAESGVDIVNLTDASLMEHGAQGLDETLKALDSKGIYRVGAGRNEMEARRPEVIDVKGKRIAYLSYSMGGDSAAFADRAGTNAQDMKEIVEDIQALRDEVDWIVVNFRWVEHVTEEPNFKQTNLARLAIDQGADVVVGYHPDVIQGAEIYKGRPIAYSVGDFVFETNQPIADQDSAMLKVALRQDQIKVEFVPVRVQDSLPKTLTGPEGEAVLKKIEQASQQFEQPMQSPLVLNLKDKGPVAPEEYDPESPFVSPEAADTLPIEPGAPGGTLEGDAPEEDTLDLKSPAPVDGESELSPPTAAPEAAPPPLEGLDLREKLDDNLLQWGPKPSDGQREFHPIPQKLQDSKGDEVDAQLPASLRRQLPAANPDVGSPALPGAEPAPLRGASIPGQGEATADPAGVPPIEGLNISPHPAQPPEGQLRPQTITPHSEPLVGPLGALEKPQPHRPSLQAQPGLLSQLAQETLPEASEAPTPGPLAAVHGSGKPQGIKQP
jgi:hypothetical protein